MPQDPEDWALESDRERAKRGKAKGAERQSHLSHIHIQVYV